MTMLSCRLPDPDAAELRRWAEHLGVDLSALVREALRLHLVRLAAEQDVAAWVALPASNAERSVDELADWGPADDWSDWADAPG